jgi:hypothetical protein
VGHLVVEELVAVEDVERDGQGGARRGWEGQEEHHEVERNRAERRRTKKPKTRETK